MQAKERHKKTNKKLNPKKFIAFLGCFGMLVYFSFILIHQHICLCEREKIAAEYQEKISTAKLNQQQLKNELAKVKTDEYLEKLAREKLGLIKPNERVFVDVTRDK